MVWRWPNCNDVTQHASVDVTGVGTIRSGLTYVFINKPGLCASYGKTSEIVNVGGVIWIGLDTFTFVPSCQTRSLTRYRYEFVQLSHIISVVEVGLQHGRVVVTRHLH